MLIEGLCLRCFIVIYSSLTWPQHVYFGTLVTIFYQEYRLHQLVPTLHQLHLGPPAVTFLDKWLSLLTPQVCLQWLTDRIDHHSSCSCICAGGRGKEWKSGKRIQRSAWIDRHRVVTFETKAARSRWKPSADGKQRAWREMWVPLERIQLHLRQTCQKKQLSPSAGQGRHSSSAGALGVRMGARLSESLTGTVKGQPVPGRWRQLLGVSHMGREEIQRNNLSMPSTCTQWETGWRWTRSWGCYSCYFTT